MHHWAVNVLVCISWPQGVAYNFNFLTSHSNVPLRATKLYLEPVSGKPQSTRCSRSSQTLPRGSGGDTFSHPPAREGRREESGSHSDIDLQPGQRAISPETQLSLYTENTFIHALTARCMNPHVPSPSLCICQHTCPRTCFGWLHWKEVPKSHCLAGGNTPWKWHCHLKQTKQIRLLKNPLYIPVLWLLNTASIRLACIHWQGKWRKGALTPAPQCIEPLDWTDSSTDIPAVCWWPLTSGPVHFSLSRFFSFLNSLIRESESCVKSSINHSVFAGCDVYIITSSEIWKPLF